MFNKLKQFKDIRDQAKTLQNQLADESVEVSEFGGRISLKMDGNMSVQDFSIDPEMLRPENAKQIEESTKDAFNNAQKKIQKIMAEKMRESGGMDMFKN